MTATTLEQAVEAATELERKIQKEGLPAGYAELDHSIEVFMDDGYPLESIIPTGADASLGFSLRRADGKGFFEIYADLLRDRLCEPGGELNKVARSGASTTAGAILTAIVTALGIPLMALGVIIPVAAIIAVTGVEAFCKLTAT